MNLFRKLFSRSADDTGKFDDINVEEDFSMYITPKKDVIKNEYLMNKLHPTIHWEPTTTLTYLEPLEFDKHFIAYAKDYKTRIVDGNFIFNPAEGIVLPAGSHELSVTFIPLKSYKYLSATATRTVTVLKRRPVVRWENPCFILNYIPDPYLFGGQKEQLERQRSLSHASSCDEATVSSKTLSKANSFIDVLSCSEHNVNSDNTDAHVLTTTKITHEAPSQTPTTIAALTSTTTPAPAMELFYGTTLQPFHFEGALCELPNGRYFFSHTAGMKLEIGKHTVSVEYEPGDDEKDNWSRGFAHYHLYCIGAEIPLLWDLDVAAASALIYPDLLPAELLTATSQDPEIEGVMVYEPPAESALNAGTHTITARFFPTDTLRYRTSSITREITIQQATIELHWPRPVALADGDLLNEFILCCKNTFDKVSMPGEYIYDPPAGTALPQGLHPLYVIFKPEDSVNFKDATTSVNFRVLPKRNPMLYWPTPYDITYPTKLTRAQLNASNNGGYIKGEWKYEPDIGTILEAGEHTLKATFYPEKASIAVSSITTQLIVHASISRLIWREPDSILEGAALFDNVLNCICTNITGTFVYTPGKSTALPAGKHKLHVHFTPDDLHNFEVAETTVTLLVRERPKATPKLTWQDPVCPPIHFNTRLSEKYMNPVCTNKLRGYFLFDPPVNSKPSVGEHVLTAKFMPEDIVNCTQNETVTSTITVLKALPVLVWNPLETLFYYGTKLSYETHLNACCDGEDIEGDYIYTPCEGSILDSGEHIVTLTFKPTDSTNFYDVSLSITVFVRRSVPIVQWESPKEPLIYPTYLSRRKHLNPVCLNEGVTGTFEFNHSQGTVLEVGEHRVTCRFYVDNIINYMSADCEITVTVVKGVPSIIWLPESTLVYETPLNSQLHCNGKTDLKGGTFIYDPPVNTILEAADRVKFTMRYIPADTANYTEVFETRCLRVERRPPVLFWTLADTIPFGTLLGKNELSAALHLVENSPHALEVLAGGTFTYSPNFGDTPNASNSQTLSVTFTPPYATHPLAKNYCESAKEVIIAVLKSRPDIKWKPRYLNVMEGSPITEAQCNAYVKKNHIFKGYLEYTPPIGSLLPPGRHRITCEFIAEEPHNTLPAVMAMSVEIVKKPPKIVWEVDPLTGQLKATKKANKEE